jgi:hypothetical protein
VLRREIIHIHIEDDDEKRKRKSHILCFALGTLRSLSIFKKIFALSLSLSLSLLCSFLILVLRVAMNNTRVKRIYTQKKVEKPSYNLIEKIK